MLLYMLYNVCGENISCVYLKFSNDVKNYLKFCFKKCFKNCFKNN